jgi:hypothetical protein
VYGRAYVSGSVVITNGGTANVPLATSNAVSVAIYNNVPVAPIYTTATCALNYVPANPQPWQVCVGATQTRPGWCAPRRCCASTTC